MRKMFGHTHQFKSSKKKRTFYNTTKFLSYLFNFDTGRIEPVEAGTQIEFSKCSFYGLDDAYKEILKNHHQSSDKYYVVCPVYTSKSTKKMMDTQLSVTGKCHNNENEIAASVREIQEEIGITVNINKIKLCLAHNSGKSVETTFITDITDCKHFDPKNDIIFNGTDDKLKKIQVILYGKIENLLKIFSNVFNRPESNDIETIRFIRFLSINEFV